jgi:hypothetical protein
MSVGCLISRTKCECSSETIPDLLSNPDRHKLLLELMPSSEFPSSFCRVEYKIGIRSNVTKCIFRISGTKYNIAAKSNDLRKSQVSFSIEGSKMGK